MMEITKIRDALALTGDEVVYYVDPRGMAAIRGLSLSLFEHVERVAKRQESGGVKLTSDQFQWLRMTVKALREEVGDVKDGS